MTAILALPQAKKLRAEIRKKRRTLTTFELKQAQQKIVHRVMSCPQIKSTRHIGIYLDAFGEVPTGELILRLLKQGKMVYLPLVCNMNQTLRWQKISFAQWRSQRFALHPLGMKQAMHQRGQGISKLQVVLMPLVLFDLKGQRMGMGGGFYDRTLAQHPHRPYRIGLAHEFQQSPQILQMQNWDQALDAVCTTKRTLGFKR